MTQCRRTSVISILSFAGVMLLPTAPMYGQLSGAIFTTTYGGITVNGNIYDHRGDVYLNGGPQPNAPCTSAGLPDGDYYFQVTNPSGSLLLSLDAITEREVHISGGVITNYLGATHTLGSGKCSGAISVGLAPFDFTDNPGGEYKTWMTPVGSYSPGNGTFGFISSASKTDNFKVREKPCIGEGCNPPPQGLITGLKYYDLNVNGTLDPTEVGIGNWRIDYYLNQSLTPSGSTFTDLTGTWAIFLNSGTIFKACEVLPVTGAYIQTGPLVGANNGSTSTADVLRCWNGTAGVATESNLNFGNVCIGGGGGGLTLGFWSNKNGQALFGSADLAAMVALHLRDSSGLDFDPASYSAFRSWLLNATATNMAYMLSAQLAAMKLNVLHGFVNGGAFIYAPGTSSANSSGFASVSAIVAEADAELAAHGTAFAGDPHRSYQEALKNALDKANNNTNFVQPGPCAFSY